LALERGSGGEIYFLSDGAPVEFRSFVTSLLATQGVSPPQRNVPRAFLRLVARVGDFLTKVSQGWINPPVSFQEYATAAVEVTLDISKARRELGYEPAITADEGLAELRSRSDDPRELMRSE
jgi:nucleoside-diphosphate-sugar epimerase